MPSNRSFFLIISTLSTFHPAASVHWNQLRWDEISLVFLDNKIFKIRRIFFIIQSYFDCTFFISSSQLQPDVTLTDCFTLIHHLSLSHLIFNCVNSFVGSNQLCRLLSARISWHPSSAQIIHSNFVSLTKFLIWIQFWLFNLTIVRLSRA